MNSSNNTQLIFRALILLCTLILLKFAIDEKCRDNLSTTLIILTVLVGLERWASYSDIGTSPESDNINEFAEKFIEGFDRKDRLEWLNKNRGKLGQFHIQCGGCGRKKILQERVKSACNTPSCTKHALIKSCEGCKSCGKYNYNNSKDAKSECNCGCDRKKCKCNDKKCSMKSKKSRSNRSYCINKCADNIGHDTISLWNDHYIDIDEQFCYNCLLDSKSKTIVKQSTYDKLPAVNGPPGYSVLLNKTY